MRMQEKDPDHIEPPGLPEALDPALGNGALWETNPPFFNLKSVDPLKNLDHLLLDEESTQKIIKQWNGADQDSSPENLALELTGAMSRNTDDKSENTDSNPQQIISGNKVNKTMEIEWAEDSLPPETESEDPSPPPPEEFIEPKESLAQAKPGPPGKVGKRVRKVVKKARDEAKLVAEIVPSKPEAASVDTQLSPFTSWLKGLRGSEYIHPYEDDYGLEQLSSTARGGVSETFADLLALQGYRDKAREMYILLMEKYPEKSSFFAAKIEALK